MKPLHIEPVRGGFPCPVGVTIDPAHWSVRREPLDDAVIVVRAHVSGDPHGKVDVAILGEGYTRAEVGKFVADLEHFTAVMLAQEPYASRADQFNIRGVLVVSQDSGCDEPSRGVHRRTALGCTFDSLGSERYMLTEDNRAMRDIAQAVPYDVLYIMVNHERYGGGGIYNLFCTFTSDNQWSEYVFLHEFGHSFAGLADEYYTSNVAYTDFYPAGYEPRDRNITALADPSALKWGDLASGGDLPTEWNKAEYDAMGDAGADQGDRPAFLGLRGGVSHDESVGAAGKTAVEDQGSLLHRRPVRLRAHDDANGRCGHGVPFCVSRSEPRTIVRSGEGAIGVLAVPGAPRCCEIPDRVRDG